jgi:hypothetical protein
VLQVHLEPQEPIEISELSHALGSLARQYQEFAVEHRLAQKASDARLLVSNVKPGSIDISLLPEWTGVVLSGPLLAPLIDKYQLVSKFAEHIKKLIGLFSDGKESAVSVKDCDDAINIVQPIAKHGGTQTFNVIHDNRTFNILTTDTREARRVIEQATRRKGQLQAPEEKPEKRQRVSMTWNRLDRDKAKTEGRSPDRGTIEEIDPKPRAVLFTDELSYLKNEMIADEENPYQQVYFVDVEISRAAGGKVTAYRVVGYHGKDELAA